MVAGHPIENIMKTTMENIKEMIDVNTIVGDAVETSEGTVIIPISKVSFGFVAGGGEYADNEKGPKKDNTNVENTEAGSTLPFAGGTGAGVSVNPIAFLVVGKNNKVKLLPVHFNNTVDRVVELVPQVVEEIQNMLGPKNNKGKVVTRTEEYTQ